MTWHYFCRLTCSIGTYRPLLISLCVFFRVSNGTPAGVGMTYANLGNLPGGNLGWEERPVHPIEHRSNRDADRTSSGSNIKPQTPSSDQQSYHRQHGSNLQRNSRPEMAEITDLVEAMHNLRTRKSDYLYDSILLFVCCSLPFLPFCAW